MSVVGAGRQVLAVEHRLAAVEELPDCTQQLQLERREAAQVERQPVTEQGSALAELAELSARATAHADPVFRRDLE